MNPKQLKDKLEKLKVLYQKENDKLIEHQENVDRLKCSIEYISGLSKIKPQIIYNSGRDKKYIYGQIYYFVEPQSPKKKSFRFMISKMDENLSRKKLEKICLDTFYSKVVGENPI